MGSEPGGSRTYQNWIPMTMMISGIYLFDLWSPYKTDLYNLKSYIEPISRPTDYIRSHSPECLRCGDPLGDFPNIFWSCPVSRFWVGVLALTNGVISVPLQSSMSIWILGLVEHIIPTVPELTLSSLLLYHARKAIPLHCKKSSPPSKTFWKQLVWSYKDAYANRGCPRTYHRVWSKWLADPSTASEMNV